MVIWRETLNISKILPKYFHVEYGYADMYINHIRGRNLTISSKIDNFLPLHLTCIIKFSSDMLLSSTKWVEFTHTKMQI